MRPMPGEVAYRVAVSGLLTDVGSTGTTMPSASMSSSTVMKTKIKPARRDAGGLDGIVTSICPAAWRRDFFSPAA